MSLWEIKPQVILIMTSLIIGLVTGLLFDIYRRIRNLLSPGLYLTVLGDLCFWAIITIITFTSLLDVSSGQVRGYIFLCIMLGLSFYLRFISRYVIYFFIELDILASIIFRKMLSFINKIYKCKFFRIVGRIYSDARRIFLKTKRK